MDIFEDLNTIKLIQLTKDNLSKKNGSMYYFQGHMKHLLQLSLFWVKKHSLYLSKN